MLRVEPGKGSAIELEIWTLTASAFGRFVAAVPPPLSIGTIRLADGGSVKGFIVEAAALDGARDISSFGGWRAYMAVGVRTLLLLPACGVETSKARSEKVGMRGCLDELERREYAESPPHPKFVGREESVFQAARVFGGAKSAAR